MVRILLIGLLQPNEEYAVSNLLEMPWHPGGKPLVRKVDRQVSRRNPKSEVEQESDWLGWDAWVSTNGFSWATRDPTNVV